MRQSISIKRKNNNLSSKKWRSKNKDKFRQIINNWRENNREKSRYYACKTSSKKRKLIFELTLEKYLEIIKNPCTYCSKLDNNGIDRINNKEGYTLKNSVSCCRLCNWMKKDMRSLEFLNHCLIVANKFKNNYIY